MRVLRSAPGLGPGWRRTLARAGAALTALVAIGLVAGSGALHGEAAPLPQEPPRTGGAYWFGRYGCSACHGGRGEGTPIGPSIVGRPDSPLPADQIVRQVRTPLLLMPDYPPSVVPDDQLAAIIEYVYTLEPAR